MIVRPVFFTDPNLPNLPHERRMVKFLRLRIILHHVQSCIYRLIIFPAGDKLLGQFPFALLFCFSLGFLAIEKLDAKVYGLFTGNLYS